MADILAIVCLLLSIKMIGSILFATYGLICLYKNLDFGKQTDDDSETPPTENDENLHSLTENDEN